MAFLKPSTWGVYKVYRDIENYIDFIKIIKREKNNIKSKFNIWEIKHNYFYTLYFTFSIEETESQLPEHIMRSRMVETLAPLHRYLDEKLGFAECLVPEFNQFFDDKNNPTLTYLISYRFAFNKLSFKWILKKIINIVCIILIIKYNLIPLLIEWLSQILI